MKKSLIKVLGLAVLAMFGLASCTGLNKMAKKEAMVQYSVTPNPAEMHGDSVAITITVNYPAKYFGKKVVLNVTPQLGDHKFKQVTLLGEKAEGTGTKIPYKTGGSYTYTDKVAYTPDMLDADLVVNANGVVKKKTKDMPSRVVGHGTIITPYLMKNDDKPIIGKDKFEKVTPMTVVGQTNFVISSTSYVNKKDMKGEGMKPVNDFTKTNGNNPNYEISNIAISSYASPDGESGGNAKLAEDRFEKSKKDMMGQSKDKKTPFPAGQVETNYKKETVAEDWPGFQAAVSASTIKDKDLILRVLSQYPDGEKREQEIKNMSETYEELKVEILPSLRRSVYTVNVIKHNRTDEQILALARTTADSLSVEEILYAATLTTDMNEKLTFYKSAERIYPTDWRTANNVGCILLQQNKLSDAKAAFGRAAKNSPNNPVINNNQAIVMRWEGDRKGARELLGKAKGAGSEVSYNLGLLDIQDGKYADALTNFGAAKSFNVALAKVLSGDNDGGATTIDGSSEKEDALSYYLKAIIGARKGNKDMMINNLRTATQKDPSLKAKAKTDVEFLKYREDADFQGIVN